MRSGEEIATSHRSRMIQIPCARKEKGSALLLMTMLNQYYQV